MLQQTVGQTIAARLNRGQSVKCAKCAKVEANNEFQLALLTAACRGTAVMLNLVAVLPALPLLNLANECPGHLTYYLDIAPEFAELRTEYSAHRSSTGRIGALQWTACSIGTIHDKNPALLVAGRLIDHSRRLTFQ